MPSIQGKQKAEIKLISDIPISMTSNGELRIDKFTYAIDDYCIMDMKNGSKLAHICVIGNNLGSNTLTLFQDISSRILVISMIISSMFLVLSFVIGK